MVRGCVVSPLGASETEVVLLHLGRLARLGASPVPQMPSASWSVAKGSATVAVAVRSGPCASRVTRGGVGGASAATACSAVRTSSGRTAGVVCRTTVLSIAHEPSADGRSVQRHDGGAHVEGPRAALHHPRDLDRRRAASSACAASSSRSSGRPRNSITQSLACEPVGQRAGRGLDHLRARPAPPAAPRPARPAGCRGRPGR